MLKKVRIKIFVMLSILLLTSCFSTYPIQKKFPCNETTTEEKLKIIENAYNSQMNPKKLEIYKDGVTINKKSYQFDEISYVRAQTKPGFLFLYRKYWIQIREVNGEMNIIYTRDHSVLEKANNALMCLTGLHDTNGRPPKSNTINKSSKYEDLEKLKKLLDINAITQKEYDIEKEKILKR